jgi:UDP-3-O-[3-hydroxymyristoyl] glucosamine N-acyltransferase
VLRAETIQSRHSDLFTFVQGDLAATATVCHRPEESCAESLVYLSNRKQLEAVASPDAAILILHKDLLPAINDAQKWRGCVFSVSAIPPAMAALLQYFDRKTERFAQWGERHPTAVVHERASIGKNVMLGPYCVIGADAVIGDDCLIGSHTVVENKARIGARTILHPHVFIGSACEIGSGCEIHPHTSIGSDGFGYAVDAGGKPRKIPQLGNVVVGDDVEIGSNCAVDRATLTSTYIRSGAKLDNICHIAHNCDLGENGLYTAGFMMAGSTTIGRSFVTGGNSVVSAHLTIADNVSLQGRSNVTKSITRAGAYGGYPLQPLQDALRTAVNVGHLSKMRRDLKRVMNHLKLSGEEPDVQG